MDMSSITLSILAWLLACDLDAGGATPEPSVTIESVAVKVCEEALVPAAEAGAITELHVKPGELVEAGAIIAHLRDSDMKLLVERTALEADIARRKFENNLDLLYARKSTEVAKAELTRSNESNAKYAKTVSDSELDRQRLLVEQGELEIQKANREKELAELTLQIRQNEHRTALDQLTKRQITSPLKGMVVEVNRQRGEWVQPGDSVARVVRLDKLRVEGFLPAKHAPLSLQGAKVKVIATTEDETELTLPGLVSFVSPEVDRLNAQVRVWVDIENTELKLRPGTVARVIVK